MTINKINDILTGLAINKERFPALISIFWGYVPDMACHAWSVHLIDEDGLAEELILHHGGRVIKHSIGYNKVFAVVNGVEFFCLIQQEAAQ
jgi:hypothetical protein